MLRGVEHFHPLVFRACEFEFAAAVLLLRAERDDLGLLAFELPAQQCARLLRVVVGDHAAELVECAEKIRVGILQFAESLLGRE